MAAQTCLRCGAPVEADATVCFTCGAPVGESKTPTQPVPVPKPVKQAASTPPTVRPAATPATPATASAPATAVLTARPGSARHRRWPLYVLAVALLAVAGIGAGLALRASLAAPPVSKLTTYRDSGHRFALQRPTLWEVSPEPDGVLLTDSATAGAFTSSVQVGVAPVATSQDAAAAATALAAQLGLSDVAPASRTMAGVTWQQRMGQMTGSDGTVREVLLLATVANGQLYTIVCSSPLDSFDATYTLVYQPILASFTFG